LCFEFFSPEDSAIFLREGYAGNVIPCGVLVVVQITSFLPSAKGLEFLLFDGGSPTVAVGSAGSLCTLGHRPPSSSRVADCHSVGELGFQILDKREMTLLQGGTV
jgi:hypothetical protein